MTHCRRGTEPCDGGETDSAQPASGNASTMLAPFDANTPVLLYCGGGISASVDALALMLTGRTDVCVYDGSLQEWAADFTLPLEVSV